MSYNFVADSMLFYVFSVFIAIMCLLMCVCRILIKITYLLT